MNTDWNELIHRYIAGQTTDEETRHLEASLKADDELADLYLRHIELEVSLEAQASSAQITRELLITPSEPVTRRSTSWYAWRPLTAAAAGIVFGMLCTSVVFGFVNQRAAVMRKTPLKLFDPGFEDTKQILEDGLTHRAGQWGMDEAKVVTAEGEVKPLGGEGMLRLDPMPQDEEKKNRPSRAYQLLDLRTLSVQQLSRDAEVEVSASFCAARNDLKSRYVMRVFALDEEPEQATHNFWPKVEGDGIPSETQRFDVAPGDSGWHTFSLKLRLPPDTKTLMIVLGSAPPNDIDQPSSVHYVDELQVSLITPELPLP